MSTHPLTLIVNGEPRTVLAADNVMLADLLREQLDLTGTKKGCEEGVCGACTVLVDGEPMPSCLVPARDVEGREVTTIEGIARNGELHALQKSFVHLGGIQCGFCTPGMVLSALALIRKHPDPTDAQIQEALGGNLCRCTGYVRIAEAVRRWKEFEPGRTSPATEKTGSLAVVGLGVPKKDAHDKVTGQARYTADLKRPGMLHGRVVTSTRPHARVVAIDVSKARALPGVKDIITRADVPDVPYGVSPARYDETIFPEVVRHIGDKIAAVAAVDDETARRAADLIEVKYEDLPAVFDPFEAMKDGAPRIHERGAGNINTRVEQNFGDVEKAFAESDLVVDETFVGNRGHQTPMEPHAAVAEWDGDGHLTVWTANQVPHYVQHQLHRVLGLPKGKIRVIKPHMGGGFGGKAEATIAEFAAAILSKRTGRPVKIVFDRADMFRHGRGRHQQWIRMRIGFRKDGTLTAVHSTSHLDGGAYTSYGIIATYYAGCMLTMPYRVPNFRFDGIRVTTNLPAGGAQRGHGCPQPRFAFESVMDIAAARLGLDPAELRIRNAVESGEKTVNDLQITSCRFRECVERARRISGWDAKRGKLPRGRGIGMAGGAFISGAGYPIYRSDFPHSSAVVKLSEDGTIATLYTGAPDIGQGSDTVLAQIAAEALGIRYDDVRVISADTDLTPWDLGAYASRLTLMAGNAVKGAAESARAPVHAVAAEALGVPAGELEGRDGAIFVRSDPLRTIPFAEAANRAFSRRGPIVGTGAYSPPKLGGTFKGAAVGPSPAYSFCAQVAEVSVDLETGLVRVETFYDVHDCGTVVNPVTLHGQVEGALVMGIGEALLEHVVTEKGKVLNPNLHEYRVPTIAEMPRIVSEVIDSTDPAGPYGAKEVGEGASLPVIGAIANAVADAIGVRITTLPITPEKVLEALKGSRGTVVE